MPGKELSFIKNDFFSLLKNLPADARPKWGKMNAQQMIEHTTGFFDVSTEKIKFDLVTPEEHLPKYKEFILSDKAFRENTKAPPHVVPEEPLPWRHASMNDSIDELKKSVDYFITYFKNDPGRITMHPVFGFLNFDEWVLLHYKHATHHLKQFGLLS